MNTVVYYTHHRQDMIAGFPVHDSQHARPPSVPKHYGICAAGEAPGHKPGQSVKENLLLPMQQAHHFMTQLKSKGEAKANTAWSQ